MPEQRRAYCTMLWHTTSELVAVKEPCGMFRIGQSSTAPGQVLRGNGGVDAADHQGPTRHARAAQRDRPAGQPDDRGEDVLRLRVLPEEADQRRRRPKVARDRPQALHAGLVSLFCMQQACGPDEPADCKLQLPAQAHDAVAPDTRGPAAALTRMPSYGAARLTEQFGQP